MTKIPTTAELDPRAAVQHLRESGYLQAHDTTEDGLRACLVELGTIIQTTDVTPRPGRALVTSRKPLGPHTDHHRADLVVWHCHAQADEGGETLLWDGLKVFSSLDLEDQAALGRVRFKEHRAFPDDPESHPMVERLHGQVRLYYAYWLRDQLDPPEARALEHFRDTLTRTPVMKLRLQPGDSLLVANRRVLHGRTAITGTGNRLLRRFWVSCKQGLAL